MRIIIAERISDSGNYELGFRNPIENYLVVDTLGNEGRTPGRTTVFEWVDVQDSPNGYHNLALSVLLLTIKNEYCSSAIALHTVQEKNHEAVFFPFEQYYNSLPLLVFKPSSALRTIYFENIVRLYIQVR